MKIKKYIVIILIAIMTIFYSNINYASIPQSAPGGSGGSGYELDEYGRPKTIEDFINKYQVRNFDSGADLEKYLDENYSDRFYEFQKDIDNIYGDFAKYREEFIKKEYTNNQGETSEQKKEYLKTNYEKLLNDNLHRFMSQDPEQKEAGLLVVEIGGYYIGYEYCKIEDAELKEEYTPEDFYNYYDDYKNAPKGSKEQETAIQNMHDCYNGLPRSEITDDMTDKMREAEGSKIENDLNEKPGDKPIEITPPPEEYYNFNANDWAPDSTTHVSNRIFFNENR